MSSRTFSPGMEGTATDHFIMKPRSSIRGTRGIRTTFGALESEAEVIALEDWELTPSGRAALRFRHKTNATDKGAGRKTSYGAYMRLRVPDANADLADEAEEIAAAEGVDVSFDEGPEGPELVFSDPEIFGRLYRATSFGQPEPGAPGDQGTIQSLSSRSGYRGAGDRFRSALGGEEATPRVAYTEAERYGDDEYGLASFKGPGFEYEDKSGPGAFFLAAGFIAVLYRASGGPPIRLW